MYIQYIYIIYTYHIYMYMFVYMIVYMHIPVCILEIKANILARDSSKLHEKRGAKEAKEPRSCLEASF